MEKEVIKITTKTTRKVAKKKPKKKTTSKKVVRKKRKKSVSKKTNPNILENMDKREEILISNFVALQKVLTNLSSGLDELSGRISKLLDIFEISAKALAEKDFDLSPERNNEEIVKYEDEILKKLETLADQNKIIARGLTLLHEKEKDREEKESELEEIKPIKQMKKPISTQLPKPQFNLNIPKGYSPSSNLTIQGDEATAPRFETIFQNTNIPKPLPQIPSPEIASQEYKEKTMGGEEPLEKPLPPTEENQGMSSAPANQ